MVSSEECFCMVTQGRVSVPTSAIADTKSFDRPSYLAKACCHRSVTSCETRRQVEEVQLVFRKETAENFADWDESELLVKTLTKETQ